MACKPCGGNAPSKKPFAFLIMHNDSEMEQIISK
jgi:hypothetical protein